MIDRHLRRQLRRPHRWAANRLRPRALVLMYHGVGSVDIDPWGLFVSPQNFDQHLQVLNELAAPIDLEGLERVATGEDPAPGSVAVTFDDGYANVLHEATPLLEAHGVPATAFVISGSVGPGTEYWWDELAGLVLQPGDVPERLRLTSPGAELDLTVAPDAVPYRVDQWRRDADYRDEEGRASPRMELYRTLWSHLLPVDHRTRQAAIDEVAAWAGRTREARASHRSVTLDELAALDGDTVTVGGHTTTHPLLPEVDRATQRVEIEEDRRCLGEILDRDITRFSYPFGANDPGSVEAARAAGYQLAVTTRPETVVAGVDPFRIGRFDVKNWGRDDFERRLRNWLRFR